MRQSFGTAGPRRYALLLLALAFGGSNILTAAPARAQAAAPQPVATADENASLSQAQLEQLLAPVALFPDELLMQVLMAATYPLEIVQAQRWLGQAQNAALRGDALARALEAQNWDPSVKSLVPFPDLVKMMSDQLEWTQQLGDAVLAQQEDAFNAIQVLRGRAHAAGQLQSGAQQTVTVTQNVNVTPVAGGIVAPPPQTIVIAPTNPEVVFIPAYNPNVVFGTWPWPSYPPVYIPPPVGWGVGNALLTGMAFAAGAAVVGSLWGWARPGWGRGYADINVNRFNSINVNRAQINSNRWQHDVSHRHGVAYSNRQVSNRYRGDVNVSRGDVNMNRTVNRDQSREQFRGRAEQIQREGGLGANRPGAGDRPGLGDNRPGGGDRPNLGGNRPGGGDGPGLGANRSGGGDRPNLGGNRPGGGDGPGLGANRPGGGDRPNLGGNRPGGGDGPGLGANRPGGGDRPNAGANRPNVGANRPATLPSGRPQVPQQRPQTRPAGLDGVGQGRDVRAAAQRGQTSRQAPPVQRQQIQQGGGGARQAAAARQGGGGGGARAGGPHGGGGRHGR